MQDQLKKTRFGLMRHARTTWNRDKKIQGHHDSPLTADGKKQARRWGTLLKQYSWDRIIASDIGRALETAKSVNAVLKVPLTADPRLREQDWGEWVGKTIAQVKVEQPLELAKQISAGWDFRPPGGEDRKSVLTRSQKALQEACDMWPGENILVVTHEGVIKSLVYHLSGRKFLPSEPPLLKSYRLHRLIDGGDGLGLETINDLALGSR